jgi:competence protein ComEA
MGRHSHNHRALGRDDAPGDLDNSGNAGAVDTWETGEHASSGAVLEDWETPPPPVPLWRTRIVTSAVLLLAVLAGTWWAVGWLTSPAGPQGPGAPEQAPVHSADAPTGAAASTGDGPAGVSATAASPAGTSGNGAGAVTAAGDTAGASDGAAVGGSSGHGTVTVHVAGEVREPGLVVLPAGSRIADAVQAAGGATAEAELDRVNLAAAAVDASQILVPGPGTDPAAGAAGVQGGVQGGPGGASGVGDGAAAGAAGAGAGEAPVDLNTADTATLEQLPGIGPALAGRIVDHREQVGPFASMEDVDAVSGIGPAMMKRLEGLVTW